ncbi:hypothetical protein FOL80_02665 [Lactobacillus reuteri]|uniref:hypothetical protein n=1 Tax=Limosilactobacillus reuteri TaxID=1598 RepID=UPI00146B264F|nr:hypothetical protein [Limosilactobacillus reuteri]NMV48960.1 hypothetical protein [Limosilactobacillus reuteri]NMV50884.1 hypothetical protein [Limosilactobacillus reuteri]NMV59380.1 hypothetical protein [Limosilactobacillus reuteri]NMV61190.1 hypothetical protein [Limosilactobacillus reuteri]NMV62940.1 hypothetical protein [Limosilactobacillus reuteri]
MIAYKNCTPNELDYTVGKGGKTIISVNGKNIILTFEDIPVENPKYMDIKILSVPKHVMASIIINAYLKDDTDNLDTRNVNLS